MFFAENYPGNGIFGYFFAFLGIFWILGGIMSWGIMTGGHNDRQGWPQLIFALTRYAIASKIKNPQYANARAKNRRNTQYAIFINFLPKPKKVDFWPFFLFFALFGNFYNFLHFFVIFLPIFAHLWQLYTLNGYFKLFWHFFHNF